MLAVATPTLTYRGTFDAGAAAAAATAAAASVDGGVGVDLPLRLGVAPGADGCRSLQTVEQEAQLPALRGVVVPAAAGGDDTTLRFGAAGSPPPALFHIPTSYAYTVPPPSPAAAAPAPPPPSLPLQPFGVFIVDLVAVVHSSANSGAATQVEVRASGWLEAAPVAAALLAGAGDCDFVVPLALTTLRVRAADGAVAEMEAAALAGGAAATATLHLCAPRPPPLPVPPSLPRPVATDDATAAVIGMQLGAAQASDAPPRPPAAAAAARSDDEEEEEEFGAGGEGDVRRAWRLTLDLRSVRGVESGLLTHTPGAPGAPYLPVTARAEYRPLAAAAAAEVLAAAAADGGGGGGGGGGSAGAPAPWLLHPPLPHPPLVASMPPVQVNKFTERLLPHGSSAAGFALTPHNLRTLLTGYPLAVWLESAAAGLPGTPSGHGTVQLGTAVVDLSPLLPTRSSCASRAHPVRATLLFRCRLTGKMFASRAAYSRHARALPPPDVTGTAPPLQTRPPPPPPVLVHVLDVYQPAVAEVTPVPLNPAAAAAATPEGVQMRQVGAVRVVAYLEDFGTLGAGKVGSAPPPSLGRSLPPITAADIAAALRAASDRVLPPWLLAGSGSSGDDDGSVLLATRPPAPATHVPPPPPQTPPSAAGAPVAASSPLSPDDLRAALEPAVAAAVAREEAALATWRGDAEREWAAAKSAAEEAWRRDSEAAYAARQAALEGAWAAREAERQAVVAGAQESCARVEARLRKLLTAAESKEREVERAREDARASAEAKTAELNALARRLREDAEHAIALAKQREAAAAARVAEASGEAEAAKAAYAALRAEHEALALRAASGPDAALRDAIASLQAERAVADRALADAKAGAAEERRAKEEARAQVLRLAKEVARLRDEARAREEAETQRLRVAFLAAEERYVLEGDRAALREIRRQVSDLAAPLSPTEQRKGSPPPASPPPAAAVPLTSALASIFAAQHLLPPPAPLPLSSPPPPPPPVPVPLPEGGGTRADAPLPPDADGVAAEVVRLRAERRLLTTSAPRVYSASHPLVQDIDRRISQLTAAARATAAVPA